MPPEPPSVNPSPWMALTIARLCAFGTAPLVGGLIQSTDVVSWLVDQVDPDKKYLPRMTDGDQPSADVAKPLYFRLESVMVWNLTGKTVALNAFDLQTGDVHQHDVADEDYESLGSWFDSCSGSTPPRVGFRWPASNRQKILSNHKNMSTGYGEGLRHVCNILAPKGDQIMIHFRVFWRFPATGKEMLKSIIGMMDVHSAITSVEKAVMTRSSLDLQQQMYNALPAKTFGSAHVWVTNKIIPADPQENRDDHQLDVHDDTQDGASSFSIHGAEIARLEEQISELRLLVIKKPGLLDRSDELHDH